MGLPGVVQGFLFPSLPKVLEIRLAGPAVIIARRHCNLLPAEKAADRIPYQVDPDECILCEECFDTGCPALVWQDEMPFIRQWECAGCSLCAQICPADAINLVQEG